MNLRSLKRRVSHGSRKLLRRSSQVAKPLSRAPQIFGRAVDALVSAFSPRAGLRRRVYRQLDAVAEKRFERANGRRDRDPHSRHWTAAENDRHRGSAWLGSRLSPNSGLELDLEDMRRNADELYRTNPWINNYVHGLRQYVVGTGRRPSARISAVPGKLTDGQAEQLKAEAERFWARIKTDIGVRGESLAQILGQLVTNRANDGESWAILRMIDDPRRPIPLAIEIVAASRIETPPEHEGDPMVRLGIRFDDNGRMLGVYVRDAHPDDTKATSIGYTYERAYFDNGNRRVLQYFRPMWEGQLRGVPDCAPVVNEVKDLQDHQEALIIALQVQASGAVFIKRMLGGSEDVATATAAGTDANGNRLEDYSPGSINYLGPEEDVQYINPNSTDPQHNAFMQWRLRAIAAGLGWAYGLLCKHFDNSFSGGRLEMIDTINRIRADQMLLDEQILAHVWREFMVWAMVAERLTITPKIFRQVRDEICDVEWRGDPLPWIDPKVEIEAAAKSVALGLDSHAQILIQRGYDPEEFLADALSWRKKCEAAGLPQLIPAGWTPVGQASNKPAGQQPPGRDDQDERDEETDDAEAENAEALAV